MAPPFLKRYLVALNRHKWAGLAGFSVVMGLSGVAALQPEPPANYIAEGLLTYASPPVTVSETGAALQQQGQAVTSEMLLSDPVVEMVVREVKAENIDLSTRTLRRNAEVKVNPNRTKDTPGFFVYVSYRDANERQAEIVAKTLMDTIVEQSRVNNAQLISRIVDNLNTLLPEVELDLRRAEQELERYIRLEGPAIQAAQDGGILQSITSGQQQQRQLQLALAGIEGRIQSLQSRLGLSADEAYASSALSADPIVADLRAQIYQTETQLSMLSQSLRPDHPTMVELRSRQQSYNTLLQQRVAEVIGGNNVTAPLSATEQIREASSLDPARQQLANELVTLQTQRDTLQEQLTALQEQDQELRAEYTNIPNKQLEQARLQQQVALKRNFYDQLQARLADVTIAESETVGSLVIARPVDTILDTEASRNPLVILIVGGVVGLLVGGGLVLLLDSLDATFHTLPDLQSALRQQEVPVLGLLPILPSTSEAALPILLDAGTPAIEPYERLRSSFRRTPTNKSAKVVLLTSTVDGEGKTLTAYNVAIASARAGKRTLLMEADLRSTSQSRSLRVTPDPESLVEPLRYYGQLSSCIRLVPDVENLFILPSPGPQRQAAAILESSEIRRLMEDVRGRFDQVIIDTPSLSRYSDSLLLEPLTDGLVLITRPGYTEDALLNEAVDQFIEMDDIQFLGAVINGAELPNHQPELNGHMAGQFEADDYDTDSDLEHAEMRR